MDEPKIELWNGTMVYHIPIPEDHPFTKQAKEEAEEMGSLNGSIEDGDGNYAGFLAELVFAHVFDANRDPTFEYDVTRDEGTYDLKTKRRTVKPKGYYDASIADWNTDQDADRYYFASLNTDTHVMTLLGYLDTDEYYNKATFHEKGDLDPDNGFRFSADCYNVAYNEMEQLPVKTLNLNVPTLQN